MTRELAQRLQPELEAAVAANADGALCCGSCCAAFHAKLRLLLAAVHAVLRLLLCLQCAVLCWAVLRWAAVSPVRVQPCDGTS